jgi:hypothetical protein
MNVIQPFLAFVVSVGVAAAGDTQWRIEAAAAVRAYERLPFSSIASGEAGQVLEELQRAEEALARSVAPERSDLDEMLGASESRDRMAAWVVVAVKRLADAALVRRALMRGPVAPPTLERLLRSSALATLDEGSVRELSSELVAIFAQEPVGLVTVAAMPALEKLPSAQFTDVVAGLAQQREPDALPLAYIFASRRSPSGPAQLREALRRAGATATIEALDALERSRPPDAGPIDR